MKKIILLTLAFTVIFSYQLKADNEILVNYSNIAEAKYITYSCHLISYKSPSPPVCSKVKPLLQLLSYLS